ncbi:PR-1-like protein [Rickenella mellea]|uniref:PR-1-like protein n=1 Tax=Rickenella mellea TaxID=50990 RepID=A0A4R5XFF0_9AGAM|nr:PR-1-like protein [Rickenella mellea]
MFCFAVVLYCATFAAVGLAAPAPAPAPALSVLGDAWRSAWLKQHYHSKTVPSVASTTSAASQAAPSTTPSLSAPSGATPDDISAYLTAHNDARAEHGAAPLTWSDDLASKAQEWANGCQFKHSGGSLGPYGENLAAGTGSFPIASAIGLWVAEGPQYDPSNPQASHFTQVVWKATTQVGCAAAQCEGIFDASYGPATYYVCEYNPAGNVLTQFTQNVQP